MVTGSSRIVLVCALLGLSGCAQTLGIDEAHVDPALAEQGGSATLTEGSAGSSTTSSSDLSSDAGTAGDADDASLCQRYCAAITQGCVDVHAQYVTEAACLASCAYFPQGTPGDVDGNTVNCRLTYAEKASTEPYTYCTWAGPGGDGKCGNNCQGFCSLMMNACTAESTGSADDYFASETDCQTACEAIPDIGNYSATDASQQKGSDQVQCRLYHVDAAIAASDPKTHCPHAMGLSVCVNPVAQ